MIVSDESDDDDPDLVIPEDLSAEVEGRLAVNTAVNNLSGFPVLGLGDELRGEFVGDVSFFERFSTVFTTFDDNC